MAGKKPTKQNTPKPSASDYDASKIKILGGIEAVRVFLFTQSSQPVVRILFSKDGRTFDPVESAVTGTAVSPVAEPRGSPVTAGRRKGNSSTTPM